MSNYNNFYVRQNTNVPIEQLLQLLRIVWDGDLICKEDRDILFNMGYVVRARGFNIITGKGIRYLVDNHYIHC